MGFCSPACSQNKSSQTKLPLNSFDFWDKNEWMRPEYIWINFAKLTLTLISTLLMALWAKYTGYNITFILVDTLKWLNHFKNDLKNVLGTCFENTSHLYCFTNGKFFFQRNDFKRDMETKEHLENRRRSHDSSILGDSTVQWHRAAVLGSGEQRPRGHPPNNS